MSQLLNELKRNLANAEEIGNVEWAKALNKRIAELEKPASKPVTVTETTTTTTTKTAAPKKAAKKAPARKKK